MEELDRQPNRGNTIFWSILFALVLAIFVGVSVYFGDDRIAESINPEEEYVHRCPLLTLLTYMSQTNPDTRIYSMAQLYKKTLLHPC